MSLDEILKLGNPKLHEVSEPVRISESKKLKSTINKLHNLLMEFREEYGTGRAIAAPQIGVLKRVIYLNIEKPVVIINPELSDFSKEMMELWDDCFCFPNLLVKVKRHQRCRLQFFDIDWNRQIWVPEGDLSELIQHEYDHLDGILATQRAIDLKSFRWR
jgi:peptide deformylase